MVALSTCEEYMALASTIQECLYLKQLLKGIDSYQYQQLYTRTTREQLLLLKILLTDRSKHMDIKYHFIRSIMSGGKVNLMYCPTDDMVADIMTKPVTKLKLLRFAPVVFGV